MSMIAKFCYTVAEAAEATSMPQNEIRRKILAGELHKVPNLGERRIRIAASELDRVFNPSTEQVAS